MKDIKLVFSILFVLIFLSCKTTKQIRLKETCNVTIGILDRPYLKSDSSWDLVITRSLWGSGKHHIIQYYFDENNDLKGYFISFFYFNDKIEYDFDSLRIQSIDPMIDTNPDLFVNDIEDLIYSTEQQEIVEKNLVRPNGDILAVGDGETYTIRISNKGKPKECFVIHNPFSYLRFYREKGIDTSSYDAYLKLIDSILSIAPSEYSLPLSYKDK